MLAAVAHELGTPIHSLSATVDFLVEDFGDLAAHEQMAMLERLQRNATWLRGLAQNIRLLAGSELELRPIALQECVADAAALAAQLLDRRGQRLAVEMPEEPVLVRGDRTALGQVLVNLLNNAAKYSFEGDLVELRLRVVDGQAEIAVTDHGPGIPAAEQARVFRRYARGANAGRTEGFGLGLSIVAELVDRHGGSVDVQSETGQGATFVVRLPLGD